MARAFQCALAGAAFLALAGAAQASDMSICHDESGDTAIAACTRAIESGTLSKKSLAVAYTSRGVEWRSKGQVDRAIADHTQAIKLDPQQWDARYNRGNAYKQKGDNDRAIADYNAAAKLNPKDYRIFNNRGLAYEAKGDKTRAAADLATAKRLKK